jgi:hypothetical protein
VAPEALRVSAPVMVFRFWVVVALLVSVSWIW